MDLPHLRPAIAQLAFLHLGRGYQLMARRLPELFELEPDDVHLHKPMATMYPTASSDFTVVQHWTVGLYRDHVFPRIMNRACNTKETRRIRTAVCAPLAGEVLEIGFGTGLNLPHLPRSVTRLRAVDPVRTGRDLASERLAASHVEVDFVGLDGQSLELEDDSVDAALSTWTLCSIPDAPAAIREIDRVLRPGGTFHFAEHGRAPDANIQKWQDRLNGLQQRLACGCNLNRDIAAIIGDGGMTITSLATFYAKSDPKVVGWTFQGSAA